jgi:hypothetical protein
MSVANREFKFDVQHQIILPESENQKTIAALSYGTGSVSDRTRVGEVQAFVPRAKLAEPFGASRLVGRDCRAIRK